MAARLCACACRVYVYLFLHSLTCATPERNYKTQHEKAMSQRNTRSKHRKQPQRATRQREHDPILRRTQSVAHALRERTQRKKATRQRGLQHTSPARNLWHTQCEKALRERKETKQKAKETRPIERRTSFRVPPASPPRSPPRSCTHKTCWRWSASASMSAICRHAISRTRDLCVGARLEKEGARMPFQVW